MWEILVPTLFNNHRTISEKHHKEWDEYVRQISGGLTILRPIKGYWVHSDTIFEDKMIPVRIKCSFEEIKQIAEFTKQHYNQVAVMFYEISNKVYII